MAEAVMRVLGRDETPLDVEELPTLGSYAVTVPGFGMLVVSRHRALLVQPDAEGRMSPRSPHILREVVVVDGRLEVELLLHKADRLCVVVTGAADG